jgi:hypothetical protein
MVAGPSNFGLGEAGESAALSLYLVTIAFIFHRTSADRVLYAQAIQGLVDDVGPAFAAAKAEYARRKKKLDERRTRRRLQARARRAKARADFSSC